MEGMYNGLEDTKDKLKDLEDTVKNEQKFRAAVTATCTSHSARIEELQAQVTHFRRESSGVAGNVNRLEQMLEAAKKQVEALREQMVQFTQAPTSSEQPEAFVPFNQRRADKKK